MIALTSASGKLGSAVLNAILDLGFAEPELVVCTSKDPSDKRFKSLREKGITVRYNNFDSPESLERAFSGCTKLFLSSSPRIEMDYNDAPLWEGREAHHRNAIDAAVKVGVKHIYYTSLAFGNPSKAGVMRAHIRTEEYLHDLAKQSKIDYTIIREGLYSESWPLYFGYYFGLRKDKRKEVVIAGDGPISWTAIQDLGLATAKIVTGPREKWSGKTLYLSQKQTWTLADIARKVSREIGRDVVCKVVSRKEYEDYYVNEKNMERPAVEWWSSSYDAIKDGECDIKDNTLEEILEEEEFDPESLDMTIMGMFA